VSCQELRRCRGTIAVRCRSTLMGCGSPQSWLEKAAPADQTRPGMSSVELPTRGAHAAFAEATSVLRATKPCCAVL
jgi:hypothetical protein